MGFDEVRFPLNISYGSKGGPGFRTDIITTDSGAEQRIARWRNARRKYDVSYGLKTTADLTALIDFYIERNGCANGFRYKDWLDFSTDVTRVGTPTTTDVQIGIGDATVTTFQLTTKYGSKIRNIIKPVSGSVVIALNGVTQSSGFTVNVTTGIVTFTTAPGVGVLVTAGCQFDVPVRFGDAMDDALMMSIDNFNNGSISSITLLEIQDGLPSYSDFFYGGSHELAFGADIVVDPLSGRLQVLNATTTSLNVRLPDPSTIPPGAPILYIFNEGANSFNIYSGITSLIVLGSGLGVVLAITLDVTNTPIWYVL